MSHLTAAFMAIGLTGSEHFSKAHEHIDIGHVDMVDSLIAYAPFVDALGEAGFAAVGDYPGVFLYEVAEEIGGLYCTALLECRPGHYPDHERLLEKMRLCAHSFFQQSFHEPDSAPSVNRSIELSSALADVEFVRLA